MNPITESEMRESTCTDVLFIGLDRILIICMYTGTGGGSFIICEAAVCGGQWRVSAGITICANVWWQRVKMCRVCRCAASTAVNFYAQHGTKEAHTSSTTTV